MDGMIPLDKSSKQFDGFIDVNGRSYRIHCNTVTKKIYCDWKLRHQLRKHLDLLQERLGQCTDISQFFVELKSFLEISSIKQDYSVWKPQHFDIILTHLQELGWDKIVSVNDDFTDLTIKARDEDERDHFLNLHLTPLYPTEPPEVTATLPLPFNPLWVSGNDLTTLYRQFKASLQLYERLWNEVDELREQTWILEPENPNYAAVSFRLAIGNNCSIQLKVDPVNMGILPECHFLGAEWAVSSIRDKFQERYEDWNEALSLYQNLRNILELDFPSKPNGSLQDITLQCGICYAFRLGVEIPDQICSDKRCGQAFHHQCLLEWIRSIPGAKQSFNVVFGECPYCTNSIKLNILSK